MDLEGHDGRWEGKVPLQRGIYHVMIVNAGGSAVERDIRFALGCTSGCRAPQPRRPEPLPGCGCRSGGQLAAGQAPGLLWLATLGLPGRIRCGLHRVI